MEQQIDARQMLLAELKKRAAQENTDDSKLRGMIQEQRDIATMDPSYRTSLKPQAAFVDELTGSNLASSIKAPESTQDAMRKALQYQAASPKQNLLGYLQSQMGAERNDDAMANKLAIAQAKGSAERKMSGEQMKRLGSARLAMGGLMDVRASLEGGASIVPEFATGVMGDNAFTEARRRAVEGIGRMQSGGAINSEEAKRFMQLLPRMMDDEETRIKKLDTIQQEVQARMDEITGGESSPQQMQQQSPLMKGDGSTVDWSSNEYTLDQLKEIRKSGKIPQGN